MKKIIVCLETCFNKFKFWFMSCNEDKRWVIVLTFMGACFFGCFNFYLGLLIIVLGALLLSSND